MTQDGFFLSALVALGFAVKPPILVDDQPCAAAEGDEGPGPTEDDKKSVSEASQKKDVHDQPN